MYQVYVDYYIKFLDAYKTNNLTFWAISMANEPVLAFNSLTTELGMPLIQINSTMMVRTWFLILTAIIITNNCAACLSFRPLCSVKILDQPFVTQATRM